MSEAPRPGRDEAAIDPSSLRQRVWRVIFGYDTPAGRAFDVVLLVLIVTSVLCVMLETVQWVREAYGSELLVAEWVFTLLFTAEYAVRLAVSRRPMRYARSFFGIVDLLSILPTYVSVLLPGTQSLLVIRAIRLLRIFRVLKLSRYLGEANVLATALRASGYKVTVFLGTVMVLITIVGTLMYLIEGAEHGFTSIPRSLYWAIVTMTTVGYGDIAPGTTLGQILAGAVMLLGYSIIAVPTGIVSAEMVHATRSTLRCPSCSATIQGPVARFCHHCGTSLRGDAAGA
jgi:voltage-gated potassium channel